MPNQVNVQGILAEENVVQIVDGRLVNIANGSDVTGIAVVPWAKFIVDSSDPTVGVDPTIACNYMISDREVYPGGGLPVFQINPLAAKKRSIISKHLYVADFANRPSAVDFPGLPIMIGNFGNAIAVSDGVSYLSNNRQVVYSEQNGTLTTPTKSSSGSVTSFVFTVPCPNIPANLITPGKTIMRVNFTAQRRNGGAPATLDFAVRLGTVGDASDPIVDYLSAVAATNNLHMRQNSKITFPTSSFFITSRGNSDVGVGTNQVYEGGTSQYNITQPLILSFRVTSKNAADNVDLIDMELIWER